MLILEDQNISKNHGKCEFHDLILNTSYFILMIEDLNMI